MNEKEIKKALIRYAEELKKKKEVEAVYLCGSWAKGTYTPYSDVDLLIVVKEDARPPRDRIPAYLPDRFPVSVDLFIYTGEELAQSDFARRLLEGAIKL
ncbi:MAG: nucleotidyltransferase domain-containing protein [Bacillota bacterium]